MPENMVGERVANLVIYVHCFLFLKSCFDGAYFITEEA